MADTSIDMLTPHRLARLLDVNVPTAWSEADAAAALRHQLAAPLLPDLALPQGAELERLRAPAGCYPSLLAALTAPRPELELLLAIKQWARGLRTDAASPLAGSPSVALYFAAIAAARVGLGQSITSLSDAELRDGLRWCAVYPPAEPLTGLYQQALAAIDRGSGVPPMK